MKKLLQYLVATALGVAVGLTITAGIAQNIGGGGTINGNTITTGTGTLTLGAGKTTTFTSTNTFTGTDGQTYTFPTTSATIARTDAANTFTGTQTFSSVPVLAGTVAADQAAAGKVGEYQEVNCDTATSGASVSFTNATPTVGTWTGHPFLNTNVGFGNYACPFNITANAPTGLSTATNYWAVPIDANTFHVSTSAANAAAGTFAATSGTSATANLTSNIALTSPSTLAGAVINLTAGDWDCSGLVKYTLGSTTSVTNMQVGTNTSSTAIGAFGTFTDNETAANVMTATNNPVLTTPTNRINISTTTAEYLVANATFTVSTANASGQFRCRRER